MATVDLNVEDLFRTRLAGLGNKAKRRLIEMLSSSLVPSRTAKDDADAMFDNIVGAWSDDGLTAEEEIARLCYKTEID